jgi:gamma-glutamylaminecyclotransferase
MREPLFVYGSLKRGYAHHDRLARAQWLRDASTAPGYRLIVYGSYPALVCGGESVVRGELWNVDAALLAELDLFEDVPNLYLRRSVELDDGSSAQSYFAAREGNFVPIAGGLWLER